MIFKSAPENKAVMSTSLDPDCLTLEYRAIVPRTLKLLHQRISTAATWKRNSNYHKKYCLPNDGGELIDTSGSVGFTKTLPCEGISETVSHIITNFRRKVTLSNYASA